MLSKLLTPPRDDLIPGRRLAPRCTLGSIAAAEEFFIQHHVSLASSNADQLSESSLAAIRSTAAADAARWFRYGNSLFATRILSGRGKVLTICLALRDADPACRDITWESARDLASTADPAALDDFILEYWGWTNLEKKLPPESQQTPPAPTQQSRNPQSRAVSARRHPPNARAPAQRPPTPTPPQEPPPSTGPSSSPASSPSTPPGPTPPSPP